MFVILLYIKSTGKVSFQIQGKNQDFGNKIKEAVINNCQISENISYNFSISYDEMLFSDFITYITEECNAVKLSQKSSVIGEQYQYQAPYYDTITIHKYNNGTLFLQGKPLWLSQQINYFFSDKNCYYEILEAQKNTYHINSDISNIETIREEIFGNANSKLNDDIVTMITTSLAFTKIEIENLPDYTAFVSPALRCLESLIQQILVKNNIQCTKKK